jgi:DNA-binding response OmpR family regulator
MDGISTPCSAVRPPAPRVLLAEDDQDFRGLLATVLRADGYEVLEAGNGAELFDYVAFGLMGGHAKRSFDVIVSDIEMPGYSGLEVLGGIRDASVTIPVILITAFGDPEKHQAAERLGARLLDKPFDLGELEQAVDAALSNRPSAGPPERQSA